MKKCEILPFDWGYVAVKIWKKLLYCTFRKGAKLLFTFIRSYYTAHYFGSKGAKLFKVALLLGVWGDPPTKEARRRSLTRRCTPIKVWYYLPGNKSQIISTNKRQKRRDEVA